jgi:hypothetical protein
MWSPDPITPLHGVGEELPISVTITYEPDVEVPPLPEPVSYTAEWITDPIPELVTLAPLLSPPRLLVSGPNLIGMANIVVSYMTDNVSHTITQWDDLPESAQQIYLYQGPSTTLATAQFKVFAHYDELLELPPEEQIYTVHAVVSYSSGRDKLVLEINLRR